MKLKKNSKRIFFFFFFISAITANIFASSIVITNSVPIIDGEIDDIWKISQTPVHTIDVLAVGKATNTPAGQWRALFDDENFYFLIEITDEDKWGSSARNNYWNGDGVEICIKTGDSTPKQYQIGYSYAKDEDGNPLRYGGYTGGICAMTDVESNFENKSGYILEILIPKADLKHEELTLWGSLWMEVCVNQADSESEKRVAQFATFKNSTSHYNSYANYTPLLLADPNVKAPIALALNGKTNICSNGADFTSLTINLSLMDIPENAVLSYLWKKDGEIYTGKGSAWNNIRPTAAGNYTCDVTINGDTYTTPGIEIRAEIPCDNIDVKTSLPIFLVNTNGQGFPADGSKTKRDVDAKIIWGGEGSFNSPSDMAGNADVHYDRKAIMNYRGSTSRDMLKKPYAFACGDKNLEDGVVVKDGFAVLDNPKEKDWILYPSYGDKSMIRNKLSMDLYREMGYYSSRMNYVDLYIDGNYQGVYILMEKYERDENRLNVTKDFDAAGPEETGYIFKLDKTETKDYDICWYRTIDNCGGPCGEGGCGSLSFHTPIGYELVYPSDKSANFENKKSYIQNLVSGFETMLNTAETDEDFLHVYKKYIDLQSFADYFIIAELAKVSDSYRISMWFTKDADGKIRCTPIWDYDMGFGNSSTHGSFATDTWQYAESAMNETTFPIPFWWKKLRTNACFNNIVRTRWEELKQDVLSYQNIENKIDENVELLITDIDNVPDTSPIKRNMTKWPWTRINSCTANQYNCPWHIPRWDENYVPGYPGGKTTDFNEQEIPLLKAWISKRLNWLDENISNDNFGIILNENDFNDCCHNLDVSSVNNVNEDNQHVKIIYEDQVINIISDESDPIQSVFIYDVSGKTLVEKNNINNINYELKNIIGKKQIIVVKILTKQLSVSKLLLTQ